jgi:hypothetical protein
MLIQLTPAKQRLLESARHSSPDIFPQKNDKIALD